MCDAGCCESKKLYFLPFPTCTEQCASTHTLICILSALFMIYLVSDYHEHGTNLP